jgi:hypothetical protein
MKGIIVSYFNSWDEVKNIIKDDALSEYAIGHIQTYKVYFDPFKNPIKVKGFDKNGENIYVGYPIIEESKKSILRDVYIYRQRNKNDTGQKCNRYHFILSDKNGQELEHEIWEGNNNTHKHTYDYTNGKKISETNYDIDGSIDWIRKYYYNEANKLLREEKKYRGNLKSVSGGQNTYGIKKPTSL